MEGNLQQYCRLCGEQKSLETLIDISKNEKIFNDVSVKLYFINADYVCLTEEGLPTTICGFCYQTLDKTHGFLTTVKKVQPLLRMIFTRPSKVKEESLSEPNSRSCTPDSPQMIIDEDTTGETTSNEEIHPPDNRETIINNQPLESPLDNHTTIIEEDSHAPVDNINLEPVMVDEKEKKWSQYIWLCPHCNMDFLCAEMLRHHCRTEHNVCAGYKCTDCGEKMDEYKIFVEHVCGHHPSLRSSCEYCNASLVCDLKSRIEHLTRKHCGVKCKYCTKRFYSINLLLQHLKSWKPSSYTPAQKGATNQSKDAKIQPYRVHKSAFRSANNQPIQKSHQINVDEKTPVEKQHESDSVEAVTLDSPPAIINNQEEPSIALCNIEATPGLSKAIKVELTENKESNSGMHEKQENSVHVPENVSESVTTMCGEQVTPAFPKDEVKFEPSDNGAISFEHSESKAFLESHKNQIINKTAGYPTVPLHHNQPPPSAMIDLTLFDDSQDEIVETPVLQLDQMHDMKLDDARETTVESLANHLGTPLVEKMAGLPETSLLPMIKPVRTYKRIRNNDVVPTLIVPLNQQTSSLASNKQTTRKQQPYIRNRISDPNSLLVQGKELPLLDTTSSPSSVHLHCPDSSEPESQVPQSQKSVKTKLFLRMKSEEIEKLVQSPDHKLYVTVKLCLPSLSPSLVQLLARAASSPGLDDTDTMVLRSLLLSGEQISPVLRMGEEVGAPITYWYLSEIIVVNPDEIKAIYALKNPAENLKIIRLQKAPVPILPKGPIPQLVEMEKLETKWRRKKAVVCEPQNNNNNFKPIKIKMKQPDKKLSAMLSTMLTETVGARLMLPKEPSGSSQGAKKQPEIFQGAETINPELSLQNAMQPKGATNESEVPPQVASMEPEASQSTENQTMFQNQPGELLIERKNKQNIEPDVNSKGATYQLKVSTEGATTLRNLHSILRGATYQPKVFIRGAANLRNIPSEDTTNELKASLESATNENQEPLLYDMNNEISSYENTGEDKIQYITLNGLGDAISILPKPIKRSLSPTNEDAIEIKKPNLEEQLPLKCADQKDGMIVLNTTTDTKLPTDEITLPPENQCGRSLPMIDSDDFQQNEVPQNTFTTHPLSPAISPPLEGMPEIQKNYDIPSTSSQTNATSLETARKLPSDNVAPFLTTTNFLTSNDLTQIIQIPISRLTPENRERLRKFIPNQLTATDHKLQYLNVPASCVPEHLWERLKKTMGLSTTSHHHRQERKEPTTAADSAVVDLTQIETMEEEREWEQSLQMREFEEITARERTARVLPRLTETVDKSWTGYPWSCSLCKELVFRNLAELRAHSKNEHNKCFTIKCADCNEDMESFSGFVSHVGLHRRFLQQFCPFCNLKVEKSSREGHIMNHRLHQCLKCGEILAHQQALLDHTDKYNSETSNVATNSQDDGKHTSSASFRCKKCGRSSFQNFRTLMEHVTSHKDKEHICDICHVRYMKKSNLISHLRTHSTESGACNFCPMVLKNKHQYDEHVLTHIKKLKNINSWKAVEISESQKLKKYNCNVCELSYEYKRGLKLHMEKIHNVFNRKCKFCPTMLAMTTKEDFDAHMLTHAELVAERERAQPKGKFVCDICNASLTNKEGLRRHMVAVHSYAPIGCEFCLRRSFTERDYYNHMLTHKELLAEQGQTASDKVKMVSAQKVDLIKCYICTAPFVHIASFRKHFASHPNVHRQCEICPNKYQSKFAYQKHMLAHDKNKGNYKAYTECSSLSQAPTNEQACPTAVDVQPSVENLQPVAEKKVTE